MSDAAVDENRPIVWEPPSAGRHDQAMAKLQNLIEQRHACRFPDYEAFWQWSVEESEAFWSAWWDEADIIASRPPQDVIVDSDKMPGARWFPGARLNFAENLLRYRDERNALVFRDEAGKERRFTYGGLYEVAARVAGAMREAGVGPGDRVAAIVANTPEAVIAMLATTWLGAVWSSCSPDFGADGMLDRFSQIAPKVLIAVDGYRFKGRQIDITEKLEVVRQGLPGDVIAVLIREQRVVPDDRRAQGWLAWSTWETHHGDVPEFVQLPFDHPVYILFSSGTTGKPKCIVHGAGGTLLQHLKEHRLHTGLKRDDVLFYFTTCGWMMWNWLVSGLASGVTVVLYDGNPMHPKPDVLWQMANDLGVTVFGTSAKYLSALDKLGVDLVGHFDLPRLRCILSTGSPLLPETFDYIHRALRPGVQIASISGGTDIVSCFALGHPGLPVRRGELQCRGLGMAVAVFDGNGRPVVDEPGELVCTRPFPCMPIGFWNDPDGSRYRAAYFERFPGVWTHGDWVILTAGGGLVIEGRSDAVLNPGGVRIGTAEIYARVERLPQVAESVCVGQPWEGDVRVVLFVVMGEGQELDDELRAEIRRVLRERASPRHVPAKILQVTDIPRTRSGKLSELAVRDCVSGRPVANTTALANPEALEQFRDRPELSA